MGWNGSDSRGGVKGCDKAGKNGAVSCSPARRSIALRYAVLTLIVLVAGGGILFWRFLQRSDRSVEISADQTKQEPVKEVGPKVEPKAVETPPEEAPEKKYDKGLGDDLETIERVKREGGQYRDATGKRHRVKVAKTIFNHGTDTIICMALEADGQEVMLPPIDGDGDAEFLKSIQTPIIISPDDSEEVRQKKLKVRAARVEIKDLMDEGKHFRDIVENHLKESNFRQTMWSQSAAGLKEYLSKGDEEGAKTYIEKMNPTLRSMGVKELSMPTGDRGPQNNKKGE